MPAVSLATELLDAYTPLLRSLTLQSSSGGRFEISLDGALLFSKAALKRFPKPGEILSLLQPSLGPPLHWRR